MYEQQNHTGEQLILVTGTCSRYIYGTVLDLSCLATSTVQYYPIDACMIDWLNSYCNLVKRHSIAHN
jgi:hypothetical protein